MLKNVYKKYHRFLYLFLFLSICLTSCYPFFKNPLPAPADLKIDFQLSGAWILTTQSGHKQEMFVFPRSTGWFDMLYVSNIDGEDSSNGIEVSVMEGYCTSINEDKFLCLRMRKRDINGPNEKKFLPFMIINYEISKSDELNFKLFSGEKVDKLIHEGILKTETIREEMPLWITYDSNIVSSSSDELKEVIAKEGVKAFLATSSDEIA